MVSVQDCVFLALGMLLDFQKACKNTRSVNEKAGKFKCVVIFFFCKRHGKCENIFCTSCKLAVSFHMQKILQDMFVRLVSKTILDRVNNDIRTQTNSNQWRNTDDTISWFKAINNKDRHTFLNFNIAEF